MMLVTITDSTHRVWWRHEKEKRADLSWNYVTHCTIYTGRMDEQGKFIPDDELCPMTGIACCSKKDQFSKQIGRKRSLSKALSDPVLTFPKDLRIEFWKVYDRNIGLVHGMRRMECPRCKKMTGFPVMRCFPTSHPKGWLCSECGWSDLDTDEADLP